MDSHRDAAKDDYAKALRAYQAYLDDIRSDQRTKLLHSVMCTNTMNGY